MTAGQFVDRPFGHALLELGERYPNLVVVDADLQRATETDLFQHRFPGRYVDVGIAEANMVGVSAGLALSGKIALASTFATFITQRVCDQVVVSVAYCRANVILAGVEAGLTSGRNGASHQAVLDLSIMRSIPRMSVFVPCDATETRAILAYLMEHPTSTYMRAPRGKTPVLLDLQSYRFVAGRACCLRDGKDVAIIACGIMVERSLAAADLLAVEGISARVVNMSSIKPLDEDAIEAAARETGCIVTAENHNVLGGLGGAVSEVVTSRCPVPVVRVGICDTFGEVGSPEWLAERFKMTPTHIADAARAALQRK